MKRGEPEVKEPDKVEPDRDEEKLGLRAESYAIEPPPPMFGSRTQRFIQFLPNPTTTLIKKGDKLRSRPDEDTGGEQINP